MYLSKTTTNGSYVCTKVHVAMSRTSQKTELRKSFNRIRIFLNMWDAFIGFKSAICVQLMNYKWIYFTSYSDTVTALLVEGELFDRVMQTVGKLWINFEIKYLTIRYFYKPVVLNLWCNIKMRRLTDQCDCCEYLGMNINLANCLQMWNASKQRLILTI